MYVHACLLAYSLACAHTLTHTFRNAPDLSPPPSCFSKCAHIGALQPFQPNQRLWSWKGASICPDRLKIVTCPRPVQPCYNSMPTFKTGMEAAPNTADPAHQGGRKVLILQREPDGEGGDVNAPLLCCLHRLLARVPHMLRRWHPVWRALHGGTCCEGKRGGVPVLAGCRRRVQSA